MVTDQNTQKSQPLKLLLNINKIIVYLQTTAATSVSAHDFLFPLIVRKVHILIDCCVRLFILESSISF